MKDLSLALTFILIAASFIQGSWTQDQSDSPCSELIQQGLYDYYSQNTASSDYSQFAEDFCNQYNQYSSSQNASDASDSSSTASLNGQSSSISGGGGLSIFGIGSIKGNAGNSQSTLQGNSDSSSQSGSSSNSQVAALGQFLCGGSSSATDASNVVNGFSAYIDPNALASYDECLQLNSAGLKVTTTVRSDQQQVTIQLVYSAPVGTEGGVNVTGISISPRGSWECDGPLWNLAESSTSNMFTSQSVSMSCARNVSDTPFTVQNQSLYARASTIAIFTTTGTVTRDFIPIYANPPENVVQQLNATLTAQILQLQQEISDFKDNITQQVAALNISESGYIYRGVGEPGYELDDDGSFPKFDCNPVTFQTPFSSIPTIALALAEFSDSEDMDDKVLEHNVSFDLYSAQVTMDGFTLCVEANGAIFDYNAMWIAIGSP